MSRRLLLLLVMLWLPQAGCACLDDWHYTSVNHHRAHKSWRAQRPAHTSRQHLKDFGNGWEQGYFDVATGGNGLPPVVPPQVYWSTKYQNPEGSQRIRAWFDGYRQGAMTAHRAGVQNWNSIAVSDDVSPVPIEAALMAPSVLSTDTPTPPLSPSTTVPTQGAPPALPLPPAEVLQPVEPSSSRRTRPSELLPELKVEGGGR